RRFMTPGPDGPAWPDTQVAAALDVAVNTVANIRQRFVEGGLPRALNRKAQDRPSRVRVLDGRAEAHLIALACSDPPAGRAHGTVSLLAGRLVELRVVDAVSPSTVRRVLKKRPEALAGRAVGDPAGARRRVRQPHGAGPGPPSAQVGSLLGRVSGGR